MDTHELLEGLQAVSDSAFPKKCPKCGKIYETVEQFTRETEDLRDSSGLLENAGDADDEIWVELYRNCTCGSTLMDFCSDRRDQSEQGRKRRDKFDKALKILVRSGLDYTEAHTELIKFMHGQRSVLIESLRQKE